MRRTPKEVVRRLREGEATSSSTCRRVPNWTTSSFTTRCSQTAWMWRC